MPIVLPAFVAFFPTEQILVQVGPVAIRWYALAYVVGLVLGWVYARRLSAAERLWGTRPRPTPAILDDLLVYTALGVVVGGRLFYVLFYNLDFFMLNPGEIVMVWRGGMSFHGGLFGCAVALVLLARGNRLPALSLADAAAAVAPIGLFLGRIANFVNGELWGRVTDVPWGVVFPLAGPFPRHPSQLYEAFLEGVVLLVGLALAIRGGALRRAGLVSGLFGVGYGAARIVSELFREPDAQLGFLWGGTTMGMLLSLPLVMIGGALVAHALRRPYAPTAA